MRGDGSLHLETAQPDEPVHLQRQVDPAGVEPGPPMADFSGRYSVKALDGAVPRYSLVVTCSGSGDDTGYQLAMEFAGPLPEGPGWHTVDVVQDGEALWEVTSPGAALQGMHRWETLLAACPTGRIRSHGVRQDEGPTVGRVDNVVFNSERTNFLVAPLRRIAVGARVPREVGCRAWWDRRWTPDDQGRRAAEPRAAVVVNERRRLDALVGGVLANAVGGPLVLNPQHRVVRHTPDYCLSLPSGTRTVYLVGDEQAVGRDIARHYRSKGREVVRVTAPTAYALSVKIARMVDRRRPDGRRPTAVLTSESSAQEGAVAAALAGGRAAGLLLTRGPSLPPVVSHYLDSRPRAQVFAVGSAARTAARGRSGVTAIAGANPYRTAVKVAARGLPRAKSVVVTTGERAGHLFATGSHAGWDRAPLLLTRRESAPAVLTRYLAGRKGQFRRSVLVGGPRVVDDPTFTRLYRLLRSP